MGDWPLALDGGPIATAGTVAATSAGTVLTAAVTINTKSAWTELVASTARHASRVVLHLSGLGVAVNDSFLVDLAIGAAASEVIVAADLIVSCPTNTNVASTTVTVELPISIPAGSRVSVRYQTPSLTSDTINVSLMLCSGGFAQPGALGIVTTMGAVTADSGGTSIDPGGTAHTKGAWTQVVASTARELRALALGSGNQANGARVTCSWLVDVAVGAAASEVVVISNWLLECNLNIDMVAPNFSPFFPVTIPAGSRLAVRAQCSIIDATDRLFDAVCYGVS